MSPPASGVQVCLGVSVSVSSFRLCLLSLELAEKTEDGTASNFPNNCRMASCGLFLSLSDMEWTTEKCSVIRMSLYRSTESEGNKLIKLPETNRLKSRLLRQILSHPLIYETHLSVDQSEEQTQ